MNVGSSLCSPEELERLATLRGPIEFRADTDPHWGTEHISVWDDAGACLFYFTQAEETVEFKFELFRPEIRAAKEGMIAPPLLKRVVAFDRIKIICRTSWLSPASLAKVDQSIPTVGVDPIVLDHGRRIDCPSNATAIGIASAGLVLWSDSEGEAVAGMMTPDHPYTVHFNVNRRTLRTWLRQYESVDLRDMNSAKTDYDVWLKDRAANPPKLS